MKKIGIFDADTVTPEEILMASDFTPIRLLGNPDIPIEKVNEHIQPTHCMWARNILELALQDKFNEIHGLVTSHGCDCTNREYDIWNECVDLEFMYFLNVPLKRNASALIFFKDDLKELMRQLEEYFNVKITNEKLKEAIKLTNEIRVILKELSELRSKFVIKSSEFHELVRYTQTNKKNEVLRHLKSKKEEFQNRKPLNNSLKRILLTGSVIDDTEFVRFLENLGLQVVADDLCVGSRYFWNLISEKIDPFDAIAHYYLNKPIYSTKIPSQSRFYFLKKLTEMYKIDGVLNVAQKFCEVILYDHPFMSKRFKELEIPYNFIEVEYNRESYKQLTTRFEAFKEML